MILSDNAAAVSYINKQGDMQAPPLMEVAKLILMWASERGAEFASGLLEQGEDLSHGMKLKSGSVRGVHRNVGPTTNRSVRLLQNTKVKNFFSIHRDPRSLGFDAFAFPRLEDLLYAFPPFRLIPKVIQKVKTSSTKIILIAPAWPKRPWFAAIQKLSIATL